MFPHVDEKPPPPNPQKLSLWSKIKLGVTSFFDGAIRSIPMTILYSAVAFTLSAVIGQAFPGYDFLRTGESTLGQLGLRMIGASVIGSIISGSINSYRQVKATSNTQAPTPDATPRTQPERTRGTQPGTYYDVRPDMTPPGHKYVESTGIRH